MRTRLKSNDEVAHVWAQQKQSEGRATSVFFEGPSIYSYGRHFEMARFITPEIVLFTDDSYSPTTAGHISMARSAVSHKTVFVVPSFEDHAANLIALSKEIREETDRLNRATAAFKWGMSYLDGKIETAEKYLKTFDRKIKGPARKELRDAKKYRFTVLSAERMAEKMKRFEINAAKNEEREKRAAERRKIEQENRNIELKQVVEQWKNGEREEIPWDYTGPVVLRVKGDTIETSRRANIPLIAARKLWRRFLKNTAAPELAGLNLGNYTINSVEVTDNTTAAETQGVLTVGCHQIPFAELYRMADVLGWRDGVPLDASEVLL